MKPAGLRQLWVLLTLSSLVQHSVGLAKKPAPTGCALINRSLPYSLEVLQAVLPRPPPSEFPLLVLAMSHMKETLLYIAGLYRTLFPGTPANRRC